MKSTPDDWFTIICGDCRGESPVSAWKETEIFGPLPDREFQCPKCGSAFRREVRAVAWAVAAVPVLEKIPARL